MNRETTRISLANGFTLVSILGDICEESVDAIVNAANSRLLHSGGVAGHIVRTGGDVIQQESHKIAPVPTGKAAATGAGRLPCKFVIHAVGPIWTGGTNDEEKLLRSALASSLTVAVAKSCRTVSIPSISAGVFGMPADLVADILVAAAVEFASGKAVGTLKEIRFCNVLPQMAARFDQRLSSLNV